MLIILDGWGISNDYFLSAIDQARTPFLDLCYRNYPTSKLKASGSCVGLPKGQMGNSEVGHINLGSGRKVLQTLKEINKSINNKSFNKKINNIFSKININTRVHITGLLSNGGVHSHIDHLFKLIKIFSKINMKNIFIHAFTDGRDTSPKNGINFIKKLLIKTKKYGGKLSTVVGRYYAMDRDNRWDRTKIAYNAMVESTGSYTNNILESIEKCYKNGITDEFLLPLILVDKNGKPISKIRNGDIVLCFNFRPDRSRQLTEIFIKNVVLKNNTKINLYRVFTMTCYNTEYYKKNVISIFNKKILLNTLGEVLEKESKKQARISETEKYPHVTFFFSGGREEPFNKETRIMCPSPNVSTYDLMPKMSAINIVNKIIPELKNKNFDFICLNFANPDMVGHTGNFNKTIIACEHVDKCLKLCTEEAIKNSYNVIIVGDHGNAEYMINKVDNTPNTSHTTSLVPFIIVGNNVKNFILRKCGALSDVAPTILKLMNLPIPYIMNGKSMIIEK